MGSSLTPLQTAVLEGFFHHEKRFFLTGGAALAGYHLGHRTTLDLDLFATTNVLDEGEATLATVASDLGAVIESVQTSPTHRRRLIRRGEEAVIVDLVHDRTPQIDETKKTFGTVRVDSPEEIFANKLCAVLSRAETRDLVDVRALERSGLSLQDGLALAVKKDSGLSSGQLAWVLSQITIGPDANVPGGVSGDDLRAYLSDLIERLTRLAHPGS